MCKEISTSQMQSWNVDAPGSPEIVMLFTDQY